MLVIRQQSQASFREIHRSKSSFDFTLRSETARYQRRRLCKWERREARCEHHSEADFCVYILSMKLKRSTKKNSHITANNFVFLSPSSSAICRARDRLTRSDGDESWLRWKMKIRPEKSRRKCGERKMMFCVAFFGDYSHISFFFSVVRGIHGSHFSPFFRLFSSSRCRRFRVWDRSDRWWICSPCCCLVERCAADTRTRSSRRSSRRTFSANLCAKCWLGPRSIVSSWSIAPPSGRSRCWRRAHGAHWTQSSPCRAEKSPVMSPSCFRSFSHEIFPNIFLADKHNTNNCFFARIKGFHELRSLHARSPSTYAQLYQLFATRAIRILRKFNLFTFNFWVSEL